MKNKSGKPTCANPSDAGTAPMAYTVKDEKDRGPQVRPSRASRRNMPPPPSRCRAASTARYRSAGHRANEKPMPSGPQASPAAGPAHAATAHASLPVGRLGRSRRAVDAN